MFKRLVLILGLLVLFLACSEKKIVNVENCKGNCEEKKSKFLLEEAPPENFHILQSAWFYTDYQDSIFYTGYRYFHGWWTFHGESWIAPYNYLFIQYDNAQQETVWSANRKLYDWTVQ